MTPPVLMSPGRLTIAAIPVAGFLITPAPFINGPYLWFGVPSVLVWTAIGAIATVAALRIVEISYLRSGGRELDAADETSEAPDIADTRSTTAALDNAANGRTSQGEVR